MKYPGLWLLLFQLSNPVTVADLPAFPGLYHRQDDGGWLGLQKAAVFKTTAKGLELFVETGGYTNLEIDIICPGVRAASRVFGSRPVFYARGIGSSSDVALIKLAQKNGSRVFHKSSANTTVENKEGFSKKDIKKTEVKALSEDVFSVTPLVDLKPGEYLLVIDGAAASFDFGIDRKK